MKRYLIENVGPNEEALAKALSWLADGGGTLVAPLKETLRNTFGADTDREYREVEEGLGRHGIAVETGRGGFHGSRRVLALYPDRKLIEAVEAKPWVEELMVLGWCEMDWAGWKAEHSPELLPWGRYPAEEFLSDGEI